MAAIAKDAEVNPRTMSNWISGGKDVVGVDPEALGRLVKVLGIGIEDLLEGAAAPTYSIAFPPDEYAKYVRWAAALELTLEVMARVAFAEYYAKHANDANGPRELHAPDGRKLVGRPATSPSRQQPTPRQQSSEGHQHHK